MGFSAGKRLLNRELGVECSGSSEAEGSPITQTAGQKWESLPGAWTPQIIPPKLALCLIYCFRLNKTRMARSSNAESFHHSVFVSQLSEMVLEQSQRQQFTAPVPRHFPAQGHGAQELLITGLICASCQLPSAARDPPSRCGICLCLLASSTQLMQFGIGEFSGSAGWGTGTGGAGASLTGMCLQGWKPPRNTAHSSNCFSHPTSNQLFLEYKPTLGLRWKRSLMRKKHFSS